MASLCNKLLLLVLLCFVFNGICVQSASEGFTWFVEGVHVLLVVQNVFTDFNVLFEMIATKSDYHLKVKRLKSESANYNYSFCYPQYYAPEWYINAPNETLLDCDCNAFAYNCSSSKKSSSISKDISCKTQVFGEDQTCQQDLEIEEWQCQSCQCGSFNNISADFEEIPLHSPLSLPVQRLCAEYNTRKSLGTAHGYCDPYSVENGELHKNDNLDDLIAASIAFLVIGTLVFCGNIGIRAYTVNYKSDDLGSENSATTQYNANLAITGVRLLVGFIANMFHDIPHQIILLFYMKFLYTDYGYICFEHFVKYPDLHKSTFNSDEDMFVIFAKNWTLLYSVVASILLVAFNAVYQIYSFNQEETAAQRADAGNTIQEDLVPTHVSGPESCCRSFLYYFGLLVCWFLYVFSHWCWPAFVAYYYIAPALHKTWTVALVVFAIGAGTWGIIILGGCIGLVALLMDKYD